ncbi:plant UBX domain-containing protein 4-like [Asparagus officinalis]|uniref:plant UBX domain-containing protein 4-like n=1 Tax=Asparagus officinalis TaxID=4686 RepID=UPI00098E0DF8|nr:plant UBX domain-containing protein 4-like [Asparagus officinalis]
MWHNPYHPRKVGTNLHQLALSLLLYEDGGEPSEASESISRTDDSRPTTSIQLKIWLIGSRTVARFNTDHTVGDIRAFIDNMQQAVKSSSAFLYVAGTVGFPPKKLTDATQTIEQAGLTNSVVIQKL